MTFSRFNFIFIIALVSVLGLSNNVNAAYPLGSEVVLYHFEDGATATSTNSGSSATTNDGTLVGAASTTAARAKFGTRSLSSGETGDYMRTYYGNGVNPTTQSISVSLWAYKGTNTCSGNDDHIFGVSGSPTANRFYIRCSSSKWSYRIQGNSAVLSTNNASTTAWDHIVLVANAATDQVTFYVNGSAQGSPVAYTSFTLPGHFYVGNYNDTVGGITNEGAGALIDEVAIYDTALTASDVNELYQAGQVGGQVSSLAATGYEQKAYLSWVAGSGTTTDYLIEYKLTSEPTTWTTFNDSVSTTTNATVTGLTNGLGYDFRVTPKNGEVIGTVSATVSATPIVRVAFVSPTPADSANVVGSSVTVSASTTLPTASLASSTQILRLETSLGALVSEISTTTRYGDFNISHLTNVTANKDMTIPSSASGAAYVPTTNTIFIPHNVGTGSDTTISEIDANGDAIARTITCTACGDVEGITLISSIASTTAPGTFDHTFMISTENNTGNGRVFRVVIPSTGNVTINTNDYFNTGIVHGANTGLEGVAYNASSGVFYLAEEDATETLYEGTITGANTMTTNVICSNLTWPGIVTDFSDLAYNNGILYVMTELSGTALIPVNITSTSSCAFVDSDGDGNTTDDTGDYLTSIPVGGTDQGEGVTFDATGGYWYFIGEADFFAKYRTTAFTTQHTFTGLSNGSYVLKSSTLDTNGVTSNAVQRAFNISNPVVSTVTTQAASSVGTSTARLNATLTADGNASSTNWGFEYGTTASYGTILNTGGALPLGAFYHDITGLTPNTTYHYRGFVTNSAGTASSTDQTFTTSADGGAPVVPTLTMSAPSIFAQTSAYVNASMTDDGNASSTERGFRYGLTTTYTATSSFTGTFGVGSFDTSLTGLVCGTTYHVQAYAINSQGMGTASDVSFTTSACSTSGSSGGSSGGTGPIGGSGGGGAVVIASPVANAPVVPVPGCPVGFVCTPIPGVPQQPQALTPVGVNPIAAQVFANLGKAGIVIANIQSQGKRNAEIINIQKILNVDPATRVAIQGPGSPGKETNLFGPATRAAVQKFQLKYGIVKSPKDQGFGVVGPKTKAMMNALLGK